MEHVGEDFETSLFHIVRHAVFIVVDDIFISRFDDEPLCFFFLDGISVEVNLIMSLYYHVGCAEARKAGMVSALYLWIWVHAYFSMGFPSKASSSVIMR